MSIVRRSERIEKGPVRSGWIAGYPDRTAIFLGITSGLPVIRPDLGRSICPSDEKHIDLPSLLTLTSRSGGGGQLKAQLSDIGHLYCHNVVLIMLGEFEIPADFGG
jgi:hypothetical protein